MIKAGDRMIKKFVKDFLIYGSSRIITSGISILLVPFYTRVLVPGDYGIIDMMAAVSSMVLISIALEINQAIARYLPEAADDRKKNIYSSTALLFIITMYSIFAITAIMFASQLSALVFNSTGKEYIFRIAVLSIWTTGVFTFLQEQLRWRMRSVEYNAVNLFSALVSVLATAYLILAAGSGVVGIFYGLIAGNLIAAVLSLYFGRYYYRLSFDLDRLTELLKYSIPLVPSGVGVYVTMYIDRFVISRLMTLGDVGIYGISYKFASMICVLIGGVQMAIVPLIYSSYNKQGATTEIANIFRYFVLCSLGIFMFLSIFSDEIFRVFTTPPYYAAAGIVPILIAAIFLSQTYFFIPGLWIVKNTKAIAIINLAAALLNLALNLILIPLMGIVGSAFSTLISYMILFYLYKRSNDKTYPIPHQWNKIVKSSLVAVIAIIVIRAIPIEVSWLLVTIKLPVMVASLLVITLMLLRKEELASGIRKIHRTLSGREEMIIKAKSQ